MRLTNISGRLLVAGPSGLADVARHSDGRFGPHPQSVLERWAEFITWLRAQDVASWETEPVPAPMSIEPIVPSPRQIFAVGLNYSLHADESGFDRPSQPVIFTKFASALTGPVGELPLPAGSVDWEVELVVVIGRGGRGIDRASAWEHVAGLTAGQDISERIRQHTGPAPQFSLAKSHRSFAPIGPSLVTPDEFEDPDDLELGCSINGEQVQKGRTSSLIFPVPELIEGISAVVELLPGDLIFTGTPSGVGAGMNPPRFLTVGDVLESYVQGIGRLRQECVPAVAG